MEEKYVVLFHGVQEFEVYDNVNTLEDVIHEIKVDHRYKNYGRNGATIIKGAAKYQIDNSGNETFEVEDWRAARLAITN